VLVDFLNMCDCVRTATKTVYLCRKELIIFSGFLFSFFGDCEFWFEVLAVKVGVLFFVCVYCLFRSLYLRALVSTSSCSKSLRRHLKIFLGFSPVLSAIS
jgi:hypothetical protein